jgi:uncharacterized protein
MLPELERLLVIQDRDRKIRTLKQEQKNAPIERRQCDERLAAATAQLNAMKQRAKDLEVERKKLELDANIRRETVARLKTQQFQTKKNEEFQALANEVKRYEAEVVSIEDRELELMEQAEKLKGEVTASEAEYAKATSQIELQRTTLDEKLATIGGQLKEVEADRAALAAEVDEDLLDRYARIFANKGEAIVPLEHEVCMGCHMKLTTQTLHHAKAGREIVHCEQCGRILYFNE